MGLGKFWVIAIIFAVFKTSSGTTYCQLEGDEDGTCTYRVVCRYHPGNAINPACVGPNNVTFVIASSYASEVNTVYFGATNFDISVRSIIAINNTWPKIAALSFRYYSRSTYFDFSKNAIEKIDSEAFKTLINLQYLNLSNNLITELEPRSFFIVDSRHTNLEILDLSNNSIKYLPDEVFSYVPSLERLYLHGNRLKHLSDHSFIGLRYLTTLDLHSNILEMLNISLITLKSLKNLDLSRNALKKISDYEINRLEALEKFNMSNNDIETVDNNCFIFFSNIKEIDLSFNYISSNIDHAMFAATNKLEYLDLFSNRITQIEVNSFNRNPLNYLNLKNNSLTGDIKTNIFTGLNLPSLDLSQQKINALGNNAFGNMKNLLFLNLSRNIISEIDVNTFNYSTSITILDLSHNNISKLYFLNNSLANLNKFYLQNNNITVLSKNTFQNQQTLKELDLSQNNIITIEQNSLPLQSLQYLKIQNNRLTGVLERNMLSPAKYLRFLDLTFVNISKINSHTFVDMPVLARLNLSHSAIETIEPVNFEGMDNLYSFDVSYNNLTDLQFNNSLLTKLKSAYLNNNRLSNISRIFPSKCNVSYLDMSHNNLTDLCCLGADLFPNLQVLHLSNNFLPIFNNPRSNTLTNLVDLRLSSNKIREINLSYFNQLLLVDLSNNSLKNINSTFFKNIEFVQSMDLSGNNISILQPGTFQNMKNLKFLNLSSNYITKLRYGSLKGLHKTELLDLSSNRIESLDTHIFYECTQLKTLIIDYNRIKALNIERLILVTQKNLKTLSLGGNPISCQEIIRKGTLRDFSLYGLNQIEVTSIHKIYHEDNVHGIKCGEDDITTATNDKTEVNASTDMKESSSKIAITAWCAILTVIIIAMMGIFYLRWRKERGGMAIYSESRVQLGSSIGEGSQYEFMS